MGLRRPITGSQQPQTPPQPLRMGGDCLQQPASQASAAQSPCLLLAQADPRAELSPSPALHPVTKPPARPCGVRFSRLGEQSCPEPCASCLPQPSLALSSPPSLLQRTSPRRGSLPSPRVCAQARARPHGSAGLPRQADEGSAQAWKDPC